MRGRVRLKSPVPRIGHAGICEGDVGRPTSLPRQIRGPKEGRDPKAEIRNRLAVRDPRSEADSRVGLADSEAAEGDW
jgi:hypothetical protein